MPADPLDVADELTELAGNPPRLVDGLDIGAFKWDFRELREQRNVLARLQGREGLTEEEVDALEGTMNLQEAIMDAAIEQGLWNYPGDSEA